MIIDLTSEKNFVPHFEFSIGGDELDLENEPLKIKNGVDVEGDIKKGIAQTEISGKISARVVLECTRCLTEIEQDLEFPFDADFVNSEHFLDAKETELSEGDLGVAVLDDEKVDFNELVREQILLNLPEQVFCRENCKGLCEKCGANRNLIDCKCKEKEIDPRWAALKDLK